MTWSMHDEERPCVVDRRYHRSDGQDRSACMWKSKFIKTLTSAIYWRGILKNSDLMAVDAVLRYLEVIGEVTEWFMYSALYSYHRCL